MRATGRAIRCFAGGRQLVVAALLISLSPVCFGLAKRLSPASSSISLTVSAAISLKDAFGELVPLFERARPGVHITINYGGSGTLQHQIEQGAPVDIFISASETQMDSLESRGLLLPGTRVDLLENKLVLIAPVGEPAIRDLKDLVAPRVHVIALGQPSTVPAGEYATQTLTHLGLLALLRKKIVYAKDVRAVLTYVETGNADAGFVYQTDAQTSSKIRVVLITPPDSHDPIVYPGAVLKNSSHAVAARDFLGYLQESEAQQVFGKFGFAQPKSQPGKN